MTETKETPTSILVFDVLHQLSKLLLYIPKRYVEVTFKTKIGKPYCPFHCMADIFNGIRNVVDSMKTVPEDEVKDNKNSLDNRRKLYKEVSSQDYYIILQEAKQ